MFNQDKAEIEADQDQQSEIDVDVDCEQEDLPLALLDAEEAEIEQLEEFEAIPKILEIEEVLKPISDKVFYKEMAKIKERSKNNGNGILPPKKSASAYIIF